MRQTCVLLAVRKYGREGEENEEDGDAPQPSAKADPLHQDGSPSNDDPHIATVSQQTDHWELGSSLNNHLQKSTRNNHPGLGYSYGPAINYNFFNRFDNMKKLVGGGCHRSHYSI